MKGKLRRITVNSQVFLWRIVPLDAEHVAVRIWAPGQKAVPWVQVRYKYHNPWLYYGEIISASHHDSIRKVFQLAPITPRDVKDIILQAMAVSPDILNGDKVKKTQNYNWLHEGQRIAPSP